MAPVCTQQQHQLFHKKKSLLVDLEEAPRKLHSRRTITTSPVLIPNRSPPSPSSPPPAMDKEETRVVGLGGVRQEWWQKEEEEVVEEDLKEEEEVEGFRAGWGTDVYSSDEFRMYEFKVRRCMRGRSHDWTDCPFAHPGEKARRRDPRRFHYSGNICPDFRRGICSRGDSCEFAHGVFECWLHPARYRTMPCKDGKNCRRKVCFFAHTPRQLRLLPLHSSSSNYTPKPININHCRVLWPPPASKTSSTSPTSTLMGLVHLSPPPSPPISPSAGTLATGATIQYSHLSRYNTAAKSATDSGFLVRGGVMGSHKKTVLYSELLGSLEALELSSSPSFSPSTAAPLPFGCFFQESSVDPFKEGAMAANAEQNSISGGPDLDWVNELVM